MKAAIQRYIITMSLNRALAEVIKSFVRSRPDTHAKYIAYLHELAVHELDRFERLHGEIMEEKAEETAGG